MSNTATKNIVDLLPYKIKDIALSAIFGLLAQFFTIEGLRSSKSIVVMPFDYFRVIFSIGLGMLVFSEKITLPIIIGFFIIFFSSLRLLSTVKDKWLLIRIPTKILLL